MRSLLVSVSLAFLAVLTACSTLPPAQAPDGLPAWPEVRIAVFTDLHLLASAGVSEPGGWDRAEAGGFQVLRDTEEIVRTRVAGLLADRPGLVLIPGDLTRDGERSGHETLAALLGPLRDAGIPVLVIPGNHDLRNPRASGYTADASHPVPSVGPDEFAALYARFGYGSALSRDPASLSYLAEPVRGLRVLALDSVRWEEATRRGTVTAGRIREASWPWIEGVLDQASRDRVPVVAMMHHALVEKFRGQAGLFADYVVADRLEVQRQLAARGVQVVFTGHFHTLSAALARPDGHPILDIEAGTLSQYPLGYRRIEVAQGRFRLATERVTDLPSYVGRPGAFLERAQRLAQDGTNRKLKGMLKKAGVPPKESEALTEAFSRAFSAVGAGDPVRPADWVWPPKGLGPMGTLAVAALGPVPEAIWTPNEPADRTLDLDIPLR